MSAPRLRHPLHRYLSLPLLGVAVLALMMALLAAACGGDDDNAPAPAATPAAEGSATQAAEFAAGGGATPQANPGSHPQDGDTVRVHYVGTLDDGTVFDSSRDRGQPFTFVIGAGGVIPGFERVVRDLTVGQTVTERLEPAEAYGVHDPSRVLEYLRAQTPPGLKVGDAVQINGAPARVVEVTDQTVTIDVNHELAGQALTFAIELLAIE